MYRGSAVVAGVMLVVVFAKVAGGHQPVVLALEIIWGMSNILISATVLESLSIYDRIFHSDYSLLTTILRLAVSSLLVPARLILFSYFE
jgi:hypothetical protein